MSPDQALIHGVQHPYDGRIVRDKAHWAALGVLAELTGRGGVGDELEQLDNELRIEIVDAVSAIIRKATLPE